MADKPNRYNPQESEEKWLAYWLKEEIYKFDPQDTARPIFSIDTPPPTVSGKMHIGHAFGSSQQDFIARFKRMKGFNVLQPFGTDDNGLPTKLLIEKEKKIRASDMDRKEFTALVLKSLEEEFRPRYIQDWKRLGVSCDFSVFYTTINEHCQRISQKSFLDLYKQGRQYRAEAPAMYCPKCQTAISQVELEDAEKSGSFNDIVFSAVGEKLIIATTRPELLPACVAIFYHPNDERYAHLKGKNAIVPLFNFEVPILEDERADPEKGTGIVMCCTFGDLMDTEWQRMHNLPIKEAIGKNGRMTEIADKYKGLKLEEARKEIIEDLKNAGLLLKQQEITHTVNVHERCGTSIEFIHSKQWFVKYLDLQEDMLKWGDELNWFPPHMKNRYENWAKGLQWDWLISRQLPFGIPFPVWYCKKCDKSIFAKEEDLPVDPTVDEAPISSCPDCGCTEFIGEKDIINTWATSSLTPTIVKELFKDTPVYNKLKAEPMSMRPQGHDIVSFWLFNTVVKSQLHYSMKPWENCFVTGWILDPKGKKMAKSKGNVIEPQDIIKKYSADALRFMAGGSKLGDDLAFPEKDVATGQKVVTKLWNAGRFAFMHLEDFDGSKPDMFWESDQWMSSKCQETIKIATENFEGFHFFKAKQEAEQFFMQTFCDNYLEICKSRLYNPDVYGADARKAAQYTLYHCLLAALKLFAPFIPYITEELYQLYYKEKEGDKSIHMSAWPEINTEFMNKEAEKAGEILVDIIATVRKWKSDRQLSLGKELASLHIKPSEELKEYVKIVERDIQLATRAEKIIFDNAVDTSCNTFSVEIGVVSK